MQRLLWGAMTGVLLGLVLSSCQAGPVPAQAGPEAVTQTRPRTKTTERRPSSKSFVPKPLVSEPEPPSALPEGPAPIVRGLPELESFYLALDSLRARRRDHPVRILWLGDSHTEADFMTHPVREYLDAQVKAGGPGFLRLGLEGYRHGAARIDSQGPLFKAPFLPAQQTRVLDGVFGYGGIRTRPQAGATMRGELKQKGDHEVTWTLSYRLQRSAELEVRLGEQVQRIVSNPNAETESGIESFSLRGTANERFVVRHVAGDPEVFGAFCETVEPGVVLDTNGINGARAATPLAWEPTQFVEQVKERGPDLVVLAYGTNEVFDEGSAERYEGHMQQLIARLREGKEQVSCWVIGPPDAAKKTGGSLSRVVLVTEAQRRAALAAGCAFTSAYELMGGEGSYSRWAKRRPALARNDRVHLTISGYQQLGTMLAEVLLPNPDLKGSASEESVRDVPHEGHDGSVSQLPPHPSLNHE